MTDPLPIPSALERTRRRELELLAQVDALSEEVKGMALNIALYLAKARSEKGSATLDRLEPEFIRLVNGTVRVVADLTNILNAARNSETMVFEIPSGQHTRDHIEQRLHSILSQCQSLLGQLEQAQDGSAGA
ncbi:MAG: hypothetical protein HY851_05435 [candidate division Zixibacteria bacterium]|nr:hypothetical protein [candidate division Zixibacteria bacterium]